MSSPTSVKMMHPLYVDPRIRRKHIPAYIIHIWFSLIPVVFLGYWYNYLWSVIPKWIPIVLIPEIILAMYYLFIFSAVII